MARWQGKGQYEGHNKQTLVSMAVTCGHLKLWLPLTTRASMIDIIHQDETTRVQTTFWYGAIHLGELQAGVRSVRGNQRGEPWGTQVVDVYDFRGTNGRGTRVLIPPIRLTADSNPRLPDPVTTVRATNWCVLGSPVHPIGIRVSVYCLFWGYCEWAKIVKRGSLQHPGISWWIVIHREWTRLTNDW